MRDYYRDLAADYHWIFPDRVVLPPGTPGGTSPGNERLVEAVVDALPPGASVLDCACGIGTDVMALAGRGLRLLGSDGSAAMVEEAARRVSGVEFATCLWQDLPGSLPGPFDLVFCLGNSLVHTGSRAAMVAALAGMRRALAPGGTLVVDSRNWELLQRERQRIVAAEEFRERDGVRCLCLYVWTFPPEFGPPIQAEVVLVLEGKDGRVGHRRYTLDFVPFTEAELRGRVEEAGFAVAESTYHPDAGRYALVAHPI
ncbi:bifunctional 2-polyprenyl-6-hydroxyphenol methylase/3-demethylubiquinol 3-O-methyltransferase UbiG [Nonomuraea sp. WAC 01424]|uniref:class I SAM-dependent methyltransferase n=1 Tax=Nonomuraea sp. WAC 01424 TaxID=2203200 RepID=UPI00163BB1D3|nr:class I SAM-dependent methyltransferase [Nonomuraea sp. WAC 01424]